MKKRTRRRVKLALSIMMPVFLGLLIKMNVSDLITLGMASMFFVFITLDTYRQGV